MDSEKQITIHTVRDGVEFKIAQEPLDADAVPFEPSNALKEMLQGRTSLACSDREYATLMPVDFTGNIFAVISVHGFGSLDEEPAICIANNIGRFSTQEHIYPIGFYNKDTDDLLVTFAPYMTPFFPRGQCGYDRVRFHDLRSEIAQRIVDLMCENYEGHKDLIPAGYYDDQRDVFEKKIADEMFQKGVSDANDLDTAFIFDADELIPTEQLTLGKVIVSALHRDIDSAADAVYIGLQEKLGYKICAHEVRLQCLRDHVDEINQKWGWRVELKEAIKETGAKSIQVHVVMPDGPYDVKLDVDSFTSDLRDASHFNLKWELEKQGYNKAELRRIPEIEIEAVKYRGKDIWSRESSTALEASSIAPHKSFSLKEEIADARAASAQLAECRHGINRSQEAR